jgi:hypothetical protein
MSVQGTYIGNVAQPDSVVLAGTSKTDIVTATDNSLTMASVSLANDTGGAVTCKLYWFKAANATDYLFWESSVAANSTAIVSDIPIRLMDGDKIKAIGNTGVCVTAICLMNFPLGR